MVCLWVLSILSSFACVFMDFLQWFYVSLSKYIKIVLICLENEKHWACLRIYFFKVEIMVSFPTTTVFIYLHIDVAFLGVREMSIITILSLEKMLVI